MNTTRLIVLCSLASISGSALAAPMERATVPLYDGETLAKACTDALAHAEAVVNPRQAVPRKRVAATDMLGRGDRVRIATQDIEGPAGLFANVSPDEKTRAAAEDCEQKIERFDTALLQNERLYARIKATSPRGAAAIKMRKDILDAFEDTGVALPADKRARMSAILQRLAVIRQGGGRHMWKHKRPLMFHTA